MVTVDFTPTYISYVQAPQRIKQFYGGQSPQIKFGVILRDPLRRAHSAFHWYKDVISKHASHQVGCAGPVCGQCLSPSFKTYVLGVIRYGADPCTLFHSNLAETGWHGGAGDYAVQLKHYFEVFSPSQFTVFLFKDMIKNGLGIPELWRRLGLEGQLAPPEVTHTNEHHHSSLEEDLDSETLVAIRKHIEKTMSLDDLVKLLIQTSDKPHLVGYNMAKKFSLVSVKMWLNTGW